MKGVENKQIKTGLLKTKYRMIISKASQRRKAMNKRKAGTF